MTSKPEQVTLHLRVGDRYPGDSRCGIDGKKLSGWDTLYAFLTEVHIQPGYRGWLDTEYTYCKACRDTVSDLELLDVLL